MNLGRGGNSVSRNFLVVRSVVIRDGQNHCRTIIHFNQLLCRCCAISAVAHGVSAMITGNGTGHDFSWSGSSDSNQHGYRIRPDDFRRLGRGNNGIDGLTLEGSDGSGRNKKLGGSNSFLIFTGRAIAQVENQFLEALMLKLYQLFANLFCRACVKPWDAEVGDITLELVFDKLGCGEFFKRQVYVLRFRLSTANYGELHNGPGCATKQKFSLTDCHLSRAKARDFFDDIADAQTGFRGWRIR